MYWTTSHGFGVCPKIPNQMSNWDSPKKLASSSGFELEDFAETLDGGQAFTWKKTPLNAKESDIFLTCYEGVFADCAGKFYLGKDSQVYFSKLKSANSITHKLAENYLDLERDYKALKKSLPTKKDSVLKDALNIHPTLRILKQDPKDAIVSFICSSSKRIVQIKQCVELLSKNHGKILGGGFYAIPDFEAINEASLAQIQACKLGFRAAYLKKTAEKILKDKFSYQNLHDMPYTEAKKYLLTLSGIGEKVADCILLFGASKFEAFPIDTWIKKAMSEMYSISDPKKVSAFAENHFGKYAGYAQQVIFAIKRKGG